MNSIILNSLKKTIGYLLMVIAIVSGAMMIYHQYPKMSEQVKKIQEPYFETWYFSNRLVQGGYYIASRLESQSLSDELPTESSPDWEYALNRYPKELDYYAINLLNSSVMEREGTLLKQLLDSSEEAKLGEELTSRYQFIVELSFDETGNVNVEQVMGADRLVFESVLSRVLTYENASIKNMKIVYGIPKDLEAGGAIYQELINYHDEHYVMVSVPYLVVMALVVMLVTLVIPYAWICDFALVKGLLVVPLEIRFLFVIGTIFATIGAPFLVAFTEKGLLAEAVAWYVSADQVQLWVTFINFLCWSGFIFVISVHTLYVKEFFVIGPWQMIRRHTIVGQLYGLVRKKPEVETVVEEKIVYQESPGSALLKTKVLTLLPRLERLQQQLLIVGSQGEEDRVSFKQEIVELQQDLTELISVAKQQQKPKKVNLTKVIANCLTNVPDAFHQLELKTKMPNQTIWVRSYEKQLMALMDELLILITTDAMNASRCYFEIDSVGSQTQVILRYVTRDEEIMSEEEQRTLELRCEMLGGTFDYIRDGDLIKMIILLPSC